MTHIEKLKRLSEKMDWIMLMFIGLQDKEWKVETRMHFYLGSTPEEAIDKAYKEEFGE